MSDQSLRRRLQMPARVAVLVILVAAAFAWAWSAAAGLDTAAGGLEGQQVAHDADPDAGTRPAESATDVDTDGQARAVAIGLPVNEWTVLDADDTSEMLPMPLPSYIPPGYRSEYEIAIMPFDVTGDEQANIYRIGFALDSVDASPDEAGHASQAVHVTMRLGGGSLSEDVTSQGVLDIDRGSPVYGQIGDENSVAAWMEGDLMIQVAGPIGEGEFRRLLEGF